MKDPLATSGLPTFNPRDDFAKDARPLDPKFLILVVDDSADNVAMLSLDLQQQGYRVVTAANGEDAVNVATQTLPNLILMDINLPTLDGLGATRRISSTNRCAKSRSLRSPHLARKVFNARLTMPVCWVT